MPKQQKIRGEQKVTKIEARTTPGNIILITLMIVSGSIFIIFLGDNSLFLFLTISTILACFTIVVSANLFFYKNQIFFDKWSDAIRYSRYPATMIITNFSIVMFISWLKVNTSISNYLNLPLFLATTLPFLFSSLCYGLCAYHTLIGNLPDKEQDIIIRSGKLSIVYWKMGQIFLVSALVPMMALVVFIAAFMI